MALTKVTYSMVSGAKVNILDFGAIGDGVTDSTAAFIAAAAYIDANDKALYIPSGQYVISAQIVFQKPPHIVGEKYSPSDIGDYLGTPYESKGTVIISKVAGDYAILINPPANNVFIRGLYLENLRISCHATNTTGGGIGIYNCGSMGFIYRLMIEGFKYHGMRLSQAQDMYVEALQITKCGTDNVYPALWITAASNVVHFEKLTLDINEWQLMIDSNSFDITFSNAHIEQGDYPGGILSWGVFIPRYSSIRLLGVIGIKFLNCLLVGPTLLATMTKYSITAAQCPHYILSTGTNLDVSFIGCTIGCGYDRGKAMDITADGIISGNYFPKVCVEDYPINLIGNILFTDNRLDLIDDGTGTQMYGINGQGATIRGNYLGGPNNAGLAKSSGALFTGGAVPLLIGQNQITVTKVNQIIGGTCKQISFNPSGFTVATFTGSVNAPLYDPDLTWAPSASGTMTTIVNPMENQQFRIYNPNAGTFTVTNGSGISLKGGVDAVMPNGGFLQLQYQGFSGTTVEMFRNF